MCNCKEEIRQQIKSENSDLEVTYIAFDMDNIFDIINGKKIGEAKTGQRLEIGYNHTKKDKTVIRKARKTFIGHEYCPWCGTKYNNHELE